MEYKDPAVKMRDISKSFGTVLANDKVWLDIYRGEILALLGENGSGSLLVHIGEDHGAGGQGAGPVGGDLGAVLDTGDHKLIVGSPVDP